MSLQESLNISQSSERGPTQERRQLKQLARSPKDTQWMVLKEGQLEKANFWHTLTGSFARWIGLSNPTDKIWVEYELIRFLSTGAIKGIFKREDLHHIRLAARQVGLIPGNSGSQKNHIDLAGLIDLISKNIIERETIAPEAYLAYASRFYRNHKAQMPAEVACPDISLLIKSNASKSKISSPCQPANCETSVCEDKREEPAIADKNQRSIKSETPDTVEPLHSPLGGRIDKLSDRLQLPIAGLPRKNPHMISEWLRLLREENVNWKVTDVAGLSACLQSICGFAVDIQQDDPLISWMIDILKAADGFPEAELSSKQQLFTAIKDNIGFRNAFILLSRGYQLAGYQETLHVVKEPSQNAVKLFQHHLRDLVLGHTIEYQNLDLNDLTFDWNAVQPAFINQLKHIAFKNKVKRISLITLGIFATMATLAGLGWYLFGNNSTISLLPPTSPAIPSKSPVKAIQIQPEPNTTKMESILADASKSTANETIGQTPNLIVENGHHRSITISQPEEFPYTAKIIGGMIASLGLAVYGSYRKLFPPHQYKQDPPPITTPTGNIPDSLLLKSSMINQNDNISHDMKSEDEDLEDDLEEIDYPPIKPKGDVEVLSDIKINEHNMREIPAYLVPKKLENAFREANHPKLLDHGESPHWPSTKTTIIAQKYKENISAPEAFKGTVGIASMQGRRDKMEDAHLSTTIEFAINHRNYSVPLFGIFDGHGGDGCSEYIKNQLPAYLKQRLPDILAQHDKDAALFNLLKRAFIDIGTMYLDYHNDEAGSTACLALIIDDEIWVANVGDTRAILSLDKVVALSEDAKLESEKYLRGSVKRDGTVFYDLESKVRRVTGSSSEGSYSVARAVGHEQTGTGINPRAKIIKYPLSNIHSKSSCRLVIGCDGLWDVVSSTQANTTIQSDAKSGLSCKQIAQNLIRKALRNHSTDNISAMVVDLAPYISLNSENKNHSESTNNSSLELMPNA